MRLKFNTLLTILCCTSLLFCLIVESHAKSTVEVNKTEKKEEKQKEEKVKTKDVEIKDITLNLPVGWEQSKPKSRLRLAQFKVPPTEGDDYKTELQIFNFGGGGGGINANIKRWSNQFSAEGREVKLRKGTCPQGDYYILDITGTYNMSVGPPFQRKTKACKKARMLAVILQVKGNKGTYYLKLPGTAATVKKAEKLFRASFGADKEKEEAVKL